jgi:hypothetical protein
MRYVYVQSGQVVEGPRLLPINWENISNFNALDIVSLKSYGWYPHRFVEATLGENDKITGSYFVIGEDEVVEYQTIAQKSESEIQDLINQKWINIRSQRNVYLAESDWTQMTDSPLSELKKEEWKQYRQSLRDITNFDSPDHVIWPERPSSVDPPVQIVSTVEETPTEVPTEETPAEEITP